MKRSRFLGLGVLLVLGALGVPSASVKAQNANGDLPPMYWYSRHDPVGIGQGVEISTQGMGARNNPFDLDAAMAAGQIVRGAPQTIFESHDLAKTENILSDLKVNVFAEVSNVTYKGSASFNYSKLSSNNIDERRWEVTASRIQTYSLKKDPRISPTAQNALSVATGGSSTNFRSLYGNYFVSGITYRRRVRVRYICQISSQISEQDIRAAIAASSSCFSVKADVKSLSKSLSKFGSLSIEIEIDGLDGAQVISIAGGATVDEIGNSLKDLQAAVAALLSHFDDIPSGSGVEAVPGIPDQVKLRHYSTILPIQIDPFKTPNEDSLNVAFGDYIRLDRTRNRLSELAGRSYNLRLRTYLNQKAAEVEVKRNTLVNYMQKLVLNPTTYIARPNTQVAFEDPEIIRWRYLGSALIAGTAYLQLYFDVIGEPKVTIRARNEILTDGTKRASLSEIGENVFTDPATGITKRFVAILWNSPGNIIENLRDISQNSDITMNYYLESQEGSQYFLATDLAGGRQISIKLPFPVYRPK